jgi:CHAD domain-containing protein
LTKRMKFDLSSEFNIRKIVSEFPQSYQIKKESGRRQKQVYFDTFDWRLFNKGFLFFLAGENLCLRSLEDNETICSVAVPSAPVFVGDIPEGPLKDTLAPIIEMRALLRLFEADVSSTGIRVLNNYLKTVVRLQYEEITLSTAKASTPLSKHVWLIPYRGYDKDLRNVSRWFAENGQVTGQNSFFLEALTRLKQEPGAYSARIEFRLDPAESSFQATGEILQFLSKVARANEQGIKDDIDTEFLHDFRVAVRRTRAALGQIKFVYPPDQVRSWKKNFSELGKLTNQLRDFDVYLLNKDEYKSRVPDFLKADIDPLFDYVHRERTKEHKKVVRGLNSPEFRQLFQDWETFLNQPMESGPSAVNAAKSVSMLASQRICKKYNAVVNSGVRIQDDTEDRKFHELRLECKKLRYLLEFFSSLFPPEKISVLITQLKRFQDKLGRFQDLCVQEQELQSFVEKLPGDDSQAKRTIMAVGSLICRLDLEKQSIRHDFSVAFSRFNSSKNRQIFQELFATPKSGAAA